MGCRDRPPRCGGGRRHRGDDDRRRISSARATAQSRARASMNLRIHRLAVAEIDREVDFYESRQAGLGTELEDEIDAAFSLILRFPKAAPQWRDRPDRRVAVLDRFPFTLPYQITQEDIVVLARTHKSSTGLLGETQVTRHGLA